MINKHSLLTKKDIDPEKDLKIRAFTLTLKTPPSVHEVVLYKSQSGPQYYIFKHVSGLTVMNFAKTEYKEISSEVELNDSITIFQNFNGSIEPVSINFR